MRKEISLQEGIISSDSTLKGHQRSKMMNDILYLLRRLTKLARRVKSISENVDIDEDIMKELQEIKDSVKELEKSI